MEIVKKNDLIYESLKDEIVEGRLRPGERVVIPDLVKRYNVSSIPIREALIRLQQDGFVEFIPHVGARVMPFDLDRYKEILLIRVELECLATKLSIPYIDEATMTKLHALYDEMKKCVEKNDTIKYGKINKEFHMTVYSAGPHPVLTDLIALLWNRSDFSRISFDVIPNRLPVSAAEHLSWLDAIQAKDSEKACTILRHQKESATAMYLAALEEKER